MTSEELEKIGQELVEMYGDNLPNHLHEPIRFAYYVKLYRYVKEKDEQRTR
jgi:hypothetical protein